MSDFFLSNYETNWTEKLTFFISPVYSDRHYNEYLQAETWRGRSIHFIMAGLEKTVVIGGIIAVIEAVIAAFWQSLQSGRLLEGLEEALVEPSPEKQLRPKIISELRDEGVLYDQESIQQSVPKAQSDKTKNLEFLETVEERELRRKGAATILTTRGFEKEAEDRQTHYGYKGEVQGTAALRFATAKATRAIPAAISPASLKEQRELNLEQYLILKFKRFGHALGLTGYLTLPSGKTFNLEGFCEAFTVPMIASSFQQFARSHTFFKKEDWQWIVKNFNQTTSSDYTEPDDIQVFATLIQDPDFRGPISLGTGHHWHSTGTIFFGNYLIFCNRGAGDSEHGVHVYYLPDRSLITEGVIWEMTKRQEVFGGDVFGIERIAKDLGGHLVHYEKMPAQEAGNCTYISMETALLAFMVMKQLMNFEEDAHLYTDPFLWEQAFSTLRPVFEQWVAFDREMVFNDTLEEIKEWMNKENSFSQHTLKDIYTTLLQTWNDQKSHKAFKPDPKKAMQLLNELLVS